MTNRIDKSKELGNVNWKREFVVGFIQNLSIGRKGGGGGMKREENIRNKSNCNKKILMNQIFTYWEVFEVEKGTGAYIQKRVIGKISVRFFKRNFLRTSWTKFHDGRWYRAGQKATILFGHLTIF